MPIKTFKPYTASRRGMQTTDYSSLTGGKVPKALAEPKRKSGGRNNLGRTTVRFRGGGNRQRYRKIDFLRREQGEAEVIALQYDPNRSAYIALLAYVDGEKRYILAPQNLKVGDEIISDENKGIEFVVEEEVG